MMWVSRETMPCFHPLAWMAIADSPHETWEPLVAILMPNNTSSTNSNILELQIKWLEDHLDQKCIWPRLNQTISSSTGLIMLAAATDGQQTTYLKSD
jgi:hypothetical protein